MTENTKSREGEPVTGSTPWNDDKNMGVKLIFVLSVPLSKPLNPSSCSLYDSPLLYVWWGKNAENFPTEGW